jgi:hypothetical protein
MVVATAFVVARWVSQRASILDSPLVLFIPFLPCSDILEENVVQPLLVSTSEIALATETVRMILKIDDIVATR